MYVVNLAYIHVEQKVYPHFTSIRLCIKYHLMYTLIIYFLTYVMSGVNKNSALYYKHIYVTFFLITYFLIVPSIGGDAKQWPEPLWMTCNVAIVQ